MVHSSLLEEFYETGQIVEILWPTVWVCFTYKYVYFSPSTVYIDIIFSYVIDPTQCKYRKCYVKVLVMK